MRSSVLNRKLRCLRPLDERSQGKREPEKQAGRGLELQGYKELAVALKESATTLANQKESRGWFVFSKALFGRGI